MAKKFLTPIDLNKLELQNARIQNLSSDPGSPVAGQVYYNTSENQLKYYNGGASAWQVIGQSIEQLEDAVADLITAGDGILVNYDDNAGLLTISNSGILDISSSTLDVTNTSGSVTIEIPSEIDADTTGNAATATALETARVITLGGDLSGSASFDGTSDITIDVQIDSQSAVSSISGTENEIVVSASVGAVTIGLPDNVTIAGDLTVSGDLIVSGSTTYLNTTTLSVEDNKVLLNSATTGSPSVDAGIEIERGDEANAEFFWDESAKKWTASDGSASYAVSLEGHTHVASDVTDFNTAVDTEIDSYLQGSDSISISSGTIDTVLAGAASASFLTNVGGLAVDKSALETALVSDSFTKKYSETIGDNSATSFNIDHNLATRDVTVQVYDVSTYETVEVDIERSTTNRVVVTFALAPASNSYRVVVTG